MRKKIVILGAGPCGLGAGYRLKELGYDNFLIFEQNSHPGGLASSFLDKKGFTWDVGGHVLFSHYKYFDMVMDKVLENKWLYHERQAWIWLKNRFIPYPFQNNIRYLPPESLKACLEGLHKIKKKKLKKGENFKKWVINTFGDGISRIFMLPYNFKSWSYPLEDMMSEWITERVAVPNLRRIVKNIETKKDDVSWGPNDKFRFPLNGGTGVIWNALSSFIGKNKIFYHKELSYINTKKKTMNFKDGTQDNYDFLINTIPINILISRSDLNKYRIYTRYLKYTSAYVVGVGLKGKPQEKLKTKCWMYFPEKNSPFYRVTVFSNYSPNNVPAGSKYWSLIAEVSSSPFKQIGANEVIEKVIKGLKNTQLIEKKNDIVSIWKYFVEYGYPVPSLSREKALKKLLPELMKKNIYSRGRFGAWRYEVGNMDHSFMQGVEVVNKILKQKKEITLCSPEIVNSKKN